MQWINRIESLDFANAWTELALKWPNVIKENLKNTIEKVKSEAEKHFDNNTYPKIIPADCRAKIRSLINPIYTTLS